MPKRLIGVAVLIFPTCGLGYLYGISMIMQFFGYETPIWRHGWIVFFVLVTLGLGLTCYVIWSLVRLRPFGRWAALGLCCAMILALVITPLKETHLYTSQQMAFNRFILGLPFAYSAYYLLSRSFRNIYTRAGEKRILR